jgi:Rhodopirellula transposase DDE domain
MDRVSGYGKSNCSRSPMRRGSSSTSITIRRARRNGTRSSIDCSTWRGRPLTDRLAVVELIAATTTKTGLRVESALDTRSYEKGNKVTDVQMEALDITGAAFHPEWNYTIRPRPNLANRST